ncbi:chloride channel protein [Streptomyces sp. NPDC058045]|uniref:chloride channel protein n=1 Tax=Streptomyces sp. NPDC058045 TaxID=3346311 RepID=UPI0036EEA44A
MASERDGKRQLSLPAAWLPGSGPDGDGLQRWALLAVVIGAIAGAGAAGLFGLLEVCTHWVLGTLGGHHPYRTTMEGGFATAGPFDRPWAVPLVVAGGALVGALLVRLLAPEAGGHGTDAAIAAAHHTPLDMRGRVTLVKMAASAITLGSGGSGGTEGPAAQISAAFGSVIARRARLTPAQARTAVVIGLAAGVGAVFRAPLGGALLGAELLYRKDADARVIPKSLLASAAGYAVFGACFGFGPVFGSHSASAALGLGDLPLLLLVGLLAGGAGRLYVGAFHWVHQRVQPRSTGTAAKLLFPAAGGLLVGGLGLLFPGVLGTGYGLMEGVMRRDVLLHLSLWVVLLLPLAKMLGTALSMGSGGTGGIFGPGLVVGAGVGAAVWRLADGLDLAPHSPALLVVAGMAACLGPVVRAPLAVLVMAVETAGDAGLTGPAIIAVLTACVVVRGVTLYRSQPDHPAEVPLPGEPAGEGTAQVAGGLVGAPPSDSPPSAGAAVVAGAIARPPAPAPAPEPEHAEAERK